MSSSNTIETGLKLILVVMLGMLGGAGASIYILRPYQAFLSQADNYHPVKVIPYTKIVEEALEDNMGGLDPQAAAVIVNNRINDRARALSEDGVIVISDSNVISAPEDSYIEIGGKIE